MRPAQAVCAWTARHSRQRNSIPPASGSEAKGLVRSPMNHGVSGHEIFLCFVLWRAIARRYKWHSRQTATLEYQVHDCLQNLDLYGCDWMCTVTPVVTSALWEELDFFIIGLAFGTPILHGCN